MRVQELPNQIEQGEHWPQLVSLIIEEKKEGIKGTSNLFIIY